MTTGEIGRYLKASDIPEPMSAPNKRERLLNAFVRVQDLDGCANKIIRFLSNVMNPAAYGGRPGVFARFRRELNVTLSFVGYEIAEDGKMQHVARSATMDEAQRRAASLRTKLSSRNVHADILHFCRAELLTDNYFHAVLEAMKSLAEKIRTKTGLTTDGSKLADTALHLGAAGQPFLAFNSLSNDSETSEQRGLADLFKGAFGAFRNPTAHAPKTSWNMTEQDALDILTLASLMHRRLDTATRTSRKP